MRLRGDPGLVGFSRRVSHLFAYDANGRLVSGVGCRGERGPRYYLGRTAQGNVWRFGAGLPPSLVIDLARWSAQERPLEVKPLARLEPPPDPERWPYLMERLADHRPTDCFATCPVLVPPETPPGVGISRGRVVRFHAVEGPLLDPIFAASAAAVASGAACFVKLFEGEILASCHTKRLDSGGYAELAVLTRGEDRGRGYAREVVQAWADFIRSQGGFPVARPSWQDRAFLKLARRSFFRFWGEDRWVF